MMDMLTDMVLVVGCALGASFGMRMSWDAGRWILAEEEIDAQGITLAVGAVSAGLFIAATSVTMASLLVLGGMGR